MFFWPAGCGSRVCALLSKTNIDSSQSNLIKNTIEAIGVESDQSLLIGCRLQNGCSVHNYTSEAAVR